MTQFLKEYGPQLLQKGWPIVEVPPGQKGPKRLGWQSAPMSAALINGATASYSIGILCGLEGSRVCGLDFDVPDEDLANRVHERLEREFPELSGFAMERIGRAPKFLLVARAAEAGWRKMSTAEYEKDGMKAQLEVLGAGQQFLAYGIHPDTKKPYTWPFSVLNGEPCDTSPEDLPTVTREEVERLMQACERLFEESGWRRRDGSYGARTISTVPQGDEIPRPIVPPVPGVTLAKAEAVIRALQPSYSKGSYDAWLSLGMALHHQFDGSPEALTLWDRLSFEFGADAYEGGACERKWASFHTTADSVTFRTFLKAYEEKMGPLVHKLNETGLFYRALLHHGNRMAWIPQKGAWYAFDKEEKRWDTVLGETLVGETICVDVIERGLKAEIDAAPDGSDLRKAIASFYAKCLSNEVAMMDRVKRRLRSCGEVSHRLEEFDARPYFFLCANGVLDLSDPEHPRLRENGPELCLLRSSPVAYDPRADCPVWRRTVRQILGDDDEKVRFVQKLVGAALVGEPRDAKLVILRGVGANGKSLFLNTLASVFGGYAETLGEESLLGKGGLGDGGGRARSDLAKLYGARFVYCAETTEGGRLREADIKRMTGGDCFAVRAPYDRADVTIRPSWRLIMVTNHLPVIKGDDDGIWRRIADIDCPRNFERDPDIKEDPMLAAKCRAELPGILNWLIEGLRLHRAEGVKPPKSVLRAVEEYRSEMDDVGSWFVARMVRDTSLPDDFEIRDSELYANFRAFMEASGERSTASMAMFRRRMGRLAKSGKLMDSVLSSGLASWRKSNNVFRLRGYRFRAAEDDVATAADWDDFI